MKHVGMSQSAMPATQNGMTTCLETFEGRGFAASPKDTVRPQENQRLETRHVGASKRAFRARLSPIFTICSFKIDVKIGVFLQISYEPPNLLHQNRCFVRGFRHLPSIFITSRKMQRLPRKLHLVRHLTQP